MPIVNEYSKTIESVIKTRTSKGSELTHAEMDANLINPIKIMLFTEEAFNTVEAIGLLQALNQPVSLVDTTPTLFEPSGGYFAIAVSIPVDKKVEITFNGGEGSYMNKMHTNLSFSVSNGFDAGEGTDITTFQTEETVLLLACRGGSVELYQTALGN